LTPIQLSAERIRRRFGKTIVEGRDILEQCTDTIIRQVEDIRRMVDEFASFARMPKPLPASDDLGAMIREVVFMMQVANPDMTIEAAGTDRASLAVFDRRLVSQALANVIKNATEAIEAVPLAERDPRRVDVVLRQNDTAWLIDVIDTGKGFPADNRQRLLEPYMTTRDGGTGLGLAIVGKIFEDHGGRIELLDRDDGARGAVVRLWLPAPPPPVAERHSSDISNPEPGAATARATSETARTS
jgi:two-component system, NtrC family, nitrogen regulation sensor histidine kinase NtrY